MHDCYSCKNQVSWEIHIISDTCDQPDASFEIQNDGKFYRVFGNGEQKSFPDAVQHCASLNSYLAMTRNQVEWDIFTELLRKYFWNNTS